MQTRKFNNQTGGYKVDIFINGMYACSTDKHKTCKAAKVAYIANVKNYPGSYKSLSAIDKVTAHFDKR